jgi:SNF2 family DNA or RNA helicase
LRNISTAGWRFVYAIPRRFFLLLTATPIHNNLRELYSLVTLVMPGRLSTFNQFKEAFIESAQSPRNLPELRQRLSRVLIRASRRETNLNLPDRHAKTVRVEMSPREREFYDGVVALLRRAVNERRARKQLLSYVVLLREAASSVRAALATLARMCGRRAVDSREAAQMRQLVDLGRSARSSAKVTALLAEVTSHEKTIVFTEYRATQDVITAELRRQGIAAVQFHGSMRAEERAGVVRAFRENARVLVSTEAGGEGQNWQFCSRIVNFDLPWNPMRVEQRIGRVHRIGQERQVEIINFATKGTIEEHVCDLLTDKIRLFESVLRA